MLIIIYRVSIYKISIPDNVLNLISALEQSSGVNVTKSLSSLDTDENELKWYT